MAWLTSFQVSLSYRAKLLLEEDKNELDYSYDYSWSMRKGTVFVEEVHQGRRIES